MLQGDFRQSRNSLVLTFANVERTTSSEYDAKKECLRRVETALASFELSTKSWLTSAKDMMWSLERLSEAFQALQEATTPSNEHRDEVKRTARDGKGCAEKNERRKRVSVSPAEEVDEAEKSPAPRRGDSATQGTQSGRSLSSSQTAKELAMSTSHDFLDDANKRVIDEIIEEVHQKVSAPSGLYRKAATHFGDHDPDVHFSSTDSLDIAVATVKSNMKSDAPVDANPNKATGISPALFRDAFQDIRFPSLQSAVTLLHADDEAAFNEASVLKCLHDLVDVESVDQYTNRLQASVLGPLRQFVGEFQHCESLRHSRNRALDQYDLDRDTIRKKEQAYTSRGKPLSDSKRYLDQYLQMEHSKADFEEKERCFADAYSRLVQETLPVMREEILYDFCKESKELFEHIVTVLGRLGAVVEQLRIRRQHDKVRSSLVKACQ